MTQARRRSDAVANIVALAITIAISLVVAVATMFLLSSAPLKTLYFFFVGPFLNRYYLGNMLNAAVPLILAGLGIAVAFRSSMFNLGGEGQIYAGGIVATVIGLSVPGLNGTLGIVVCLCGSMAVGALLAGLSGVFKMAWKTDELITSFLASGAVIFVIDYLITGPLNNTNTDLMRTYPVPSQYFLRNIFEPSKLNTSVFVAIVAALLTSIFMFRTKWGYEMRMCGLNKEFAHYGGIGTGKYLVVSMSISGLLHGLAGGLSILGTYHESFKGFSAGIGWNGIAVALIAQNNPLGVIPAGLFYAYLDAGAKAAMLHSDVTFEIASVVQATIFYLVTANAIRNLVKYGKRKWHA